MKIVKEREFLIRRSSDLLDLDWYVLGPVLGLITISLLLLKSAAGGYFFSKQLFFLLPAITIGILFMFIRVGSLMESAVWIYVVNILLLGLVLVKGSVVMGSQRWLSLGPIHIQPSELAKIAMIVSLAAWYTKRPIKGFQDILISAFIVAPPFLLIFKQPDLGTSLAYGAIFLGMAFWAGASLTHLLILISPLASLITNATGKPILSLGTMNIHDKIIELTLTNNFFIFLLILIICLVISYKPWKSPWLVLFIGGVVFFNFLVGFVRPILWGVLHAYQQRRLTIFLDPESDPLGAGYHIVQSLLAIGNGGFFGQGWLHGRLTKGSYVPAHHTDFVFSIAGEEWGFIGTSIVVLLFLALLWRILYIATNTKDDFASLLCIGIFSFFIFHIFVNIGMTIGIMPITGVPLPFISYGGSSLVVNMFAVFLLASISWRTLPHRLF